MGNTQAMGVVISRNAKTGDSINTDTCWPTEWCLAHCYRRFRTLDIIARMGWDCARTGWNCTSNTGPITWSRQRAAYIRNEARIDALGHEGRIGELAAMIAKRRGCEPLRGNGTGDLTPSTVELYASLGAVGVPTYMFSRRPDMIRELTRLCTVMDVPSECWPWVLGSLDPTTEVEDRGEILAAVLDHNGGQVPCLAYATASGGDTGRHEIECHMYRDYFAVVFGYHSTQTKTVIGHELECPATSGAAIKCRECRRCMGAIQ